MTRTLWGALGEVPDRRGLQGPARSIVPCFFPEDGTPDRGAIDAALPGLERSIGILERRLDGHDYVGGEFTLADVSSGPCSTM